MYLTVVDLTVTATKAAVTLAVVVVGLRDTDPVSHAGLIVATVLSTTYKHAPIYQHNLLELLNSPIHLALRPLRASY